MYLQSHIYFGALALSELPKGNTRMTASRDDAGVLRKAARRLSCDINSYVSTVCCAEESTKCWAEFFQQLRELSLAYQEISKASDLATMAELCAKDVVQTVPQEMAHRSWDDASNAFVLANNSGHHLLDAWGNGQHTSRSPSRCFAAYSPVERSLVADGVLTRLNLARKHYGRPEYPSLKEAGWDIVHTENVYIPELNGEYYELMLMKKPPEDAPRRVWRHWVEEYDTGSSLSSLDLH